MTSYRLLRYSLHSNWLGLFKKVYKKVKYSIDGILWDCLNDNSYKCAEYILNNHKINWSYMTCWLYPPFRYNNKEIVLLLIKHGYDLNKEIKYYKDPENKERLEFCLEIKKELGNKDE